MQHTFMRKIPHLFIVASSVVLGMAATSCDSDYDLSKDIDTNVNIGKNFTVPVGQTVEIPVSRIIEPGENISINETSGIFEIEAGGSFDSDIDRIDPFDINGLYPKFVEYPYSNLPQNGDINQDVAVPVKTYATYELDETETELPKEVEAVYLAVFNGSEGASSTITVSVPAVASGTLTGVNNIVMKNVTITFPDIFILNNGTHEVVCPEIVLNASNKYSYSIPVTISRMELPADRQSEYISEPNANGCRVFSIHENIDITADAIVNVTPSKVNSNEIIFDFHYEIMPTQVTEINGILSPEVSIEEMIEITGLPEFIDNKENSFVANDIAFNVKISNPVGMELETSIIITPWDNETNSAVGTPVEIEIAGENAVKAKGTTKYVISNTARTVEAGTINIVCSELPTLTTSMPDSYRVTNGKVIADGINSTGCVLGTEYNIKGSYNMSVPFSFDSMRIHYTDYIDNLLEDLKDVADLTDKIILNFDAITTIPADLEASVELYDINGNRLNEIKVTGTSANTVKISGSTDGKEVTTPVTITLEEPSGSTQLEELEKVVYTIKAANANNKSIVLKSSQYLILKNGVAKIPNGITTEL